MTYATAPVPPVDPSTLRPRRVWYVVAGAIAVTGLLAGVGLFALGIVSLVRGLPTLKTQFQPGVPATVTLTAGKTWAIYSDGPDAGSDVCTGMAQGSSTITIAEPTANFSFDNGRHHWRLVYRVTVSQDGTYELTCRPGGQATGSPLYAVGDDVQVASFVGKIMGSVAALLGLPCLALVAGTVIATVTAVRRSSHKKRLQDWPRGGYPPPGYPVDSVDS